MALAGSKRKASTEADPTSRTVYIEGLPREGVSEQQIADFFADCGTIAEIRAPRYQDSGRLRGYAHVEFEKASSIEAALALDGQYIGERFITISAANPAGSGSAAAAAAVSTRPRPAGCTTLFVKNLPYDTDEEAVTAAFSRFGKVVSARLARWNHTGRIKGFGYVQFEHGFSAEAAVKAYRASASAGASGSGGGGGEPEPVTVGDRRVQLDYETGAPRGSFKTASGRLFAKTPEAAVASKVSAKASKETAASEALPGEGTGRQRKRKA